MNNTRSCDYLKKFNKKMKPPNPNLIRVFDFIKQRFQIDIYKKHVLEVGLGTGNKSIMLAKLFKLYYGLEPNVELYNIFTDLCEQNNCKIKSFNMDLDTFIKNIDINTKKIFQLIYMENLIHFLDQDFDNLIVNLTKILDKQTGFILIKNPKAMPSGWGNNEFCMDSKHFKESKWIRFRDKLKSIYSKLSDSKYLVKHDLDDFYHYWLFRI